MGDLSGKTALVTGSSRGIGRAIAITLGRAGARVGVHYGKGRSAAEETAALVKKEGGEAFVVGGDLSDFASIDPLVAAVTAKGRLDILINNAGIQQGDGLGAKSDDFDAMVAVNLKAPFFLAQKLLPHINDGGRIINISSGLSQISMPSAIVYSATKAGLNSMTQNLAEALGARRITVNAILPGIIDTDMVAADLKGPLGGFVAAAKIRVGKPQDIADLAYFLASDKGGWVTGQLIQSTGGRG